MINLMKVRPASSNNAFRSINMGITNAQQEVIVKNIDGATEATADPYKFENASSDGGFITGSRAATRNIVVALEFYPGLRTQGDAQLLREEIKMSFPVGEYVEMIFTKNATNTAMMNLGIVGFVESIEFTTFAKVASAKISIICPSPHFYEVNGGQNYAIAPLDFNIKGFTFPFSNESLNANLITFPPSSSTYFSWPFVNKGDAPGAYQLRLTAKANAAIPQFQFQANYQGTTYSTIITSGRSIASGTRVLIDVKPSNLYVGSGDIGTAGAWVPSGRGFGDWSMIGDQSIFSLIPPGNFNFYISGITPGAWDISLVTQTLWRSL